MICAVRLYTVDVSRVSVFVAAFREGGLWTDISHLRPGHVHTDLLRNPSNPSKFLSIEFWTSVRALLAAQHSLVVRSFVRWLRRQTIACENLGMFSFPPRPETQEPVPDDLTCASGSQIGGDANRESENSGREVSPPAHLLRLTVRLDCQRGGCRGCRRRVYDGCCDRGCAGHRRSEAHTERSAGICRNRDVAGNAVPPREIVYAQRRVEPLVRGWEELSVFVNDKPRPPEESG